MFDKEDFIHYYKELIGFDPYDYQIQVADYLLSGKNVILYNRKNEKYTFLN